MERIQVKISTFSGEKKDWERYDDFTIRNDIAYECDTCFGIINSTRSTLMQD
jgi:hypothetical protein